MIRTIRQHLIAYGDGWLSPVETVAGSLTAIDQMNPVLNALPTLRKRNDVIADAEQISARLSLGEPVGQLAGMPYCAKDTHRTAGLKTTFGSPIFADHVPTENEPIVQRSDGTEVYVEIELEAHREQNVLRVAHVGDPRISHRSEVDRVVVLPEILHLSRRKRDAVAKIAFRTVVEFADLETELERFVGGPQDLQAFSDDVDTDSVSRYHTDAHGRGS